MSMCFLIEEGFELDGIDEVAVVCEADAIRAVDEEGLGFGIGTCTGRGISEVSKSC